MSRVFAKPLSQSARIQIVLTQSHKLRKAIARAELDAPLQEKGIAMFIDERATPLRRRPSGGLHC